MVEYNNRNRTDTSDNRIVIEEDITTVDMDDSFRLSSTICNQLNKGVFLIMGGSSPKSFNVIQSFSHALHVPYVIYTSNRNQAADGYTYDFSVSPAYIDAIIDIIRFFQWRKIYYLFDSDDGLWQLQRVYEAFRDPKHLLLVDARRVGDPNHVHDLLRRLDRVSRSERKRIVLNFSSTEVYQKILNQIVDVGMNRENYHYLLAGPLRPMTSCVSSLARLPGLLNERQASMTSELDGCLDGWVIDKQYSRAGWLPEWLGD
ncbi:hypothetical protein C0Q70_05420 [Pomacea canaliculata]|uniref:Receptor ligand binding region domain-containing protein n=1 Tax=Pomacea canaliculata TaxID=400727 RepID=A0A2T7PL90_POMCA|nr:hypothetical protein C0Q70_05420 [Pomacea canaliculata]